MDLNEIVDNYHKKYPKYSKLLVNRNVIEGIWVLGNNYTTKTNLYGAYPHGYLDRIYTLFQPIKDKTLHLFSGSIEDEYDKVDLNNAINAEEMSQILPLDYYSRVFADPPYSAEDCIHYGCCMIRRNVVIKECYKIMEKGGILVWLDQVLPQYRKCEWNIIGRIGIVKSTNHRFRCVTIFMKI